MSAELELVESWKQIPRLQRLAASRGKTLEEQAQWLDSYIAECCERGETAEEQREELLAAFSLLSEICSFLDFDKMIDVRERFQGLFPEHFTEYLKSLESLSWQISWPGCLECNNYSGRCELGLVPSSIPDGHIPTKACASKEGRGKAA